MRWLQSKLRLLIPHLILVAFTGKKSLVLLQSTGSKRVGYDLATKQKGKKKKNRIKMKALQSDLEAKAGSLLRIQSKQV